MAATSFPIDRVSTLPLPDIYARVSRHVPAIEWPALDEHIGVEGLLAGRRSGESQKSFERWLAERRTSS